MINSIIKFIRCGGKCKECKSLNEIVYYTARQNDSDATDVQTYFYENVRCGDCKKLKFKRIFHKNKMSTQTSELIDSDYFKEKELIYHGYSDPYD